MEYNLQRFVAAQAFTYERALKEMKNGYKESHWMWFIFPQIKGLGHSEQSRFYAISSLMEAAKYLEHEILGARLLEMTKEVLDSNITDATIIFGYIDAMKLLSSMTLFAQVKEAPPEFQQVIDKLYQGKPDIRTLEILKG